MEIRSLKMAQPKSRRTFATIMSAIMACLIATALAPDASARHHKHSDNGSAQADSQVSMEIFPIKRGYDGAQFIVTKAGFTVSIPGLGVAPDATEVAAYKDPQNNIWYIDRSGTAVKLTDEQVQWGMAQINQQAQARSDAAAQQPITQAAQAPSSTTVVVEQQPAQTSGGGGSALVTGLAAAGGAFAGAALSNSLYNNNYYGIPYGVPIHHNGGRYYYNNAGGNKVYINHSSNNQSINQINQWNKQTNWQQIQHNNNKATTLPAHSGAAGRPNYPTQLPAGGHAGRQANAPTQLPAHSGVNRGRTSSAGHAVHSLGSGGGAARGASRGGGARGGRRR